MRVRDHLRSPQRRTIDAYKVAPVKQNENGLSTVASPGMTTCTATMFVPAVRKVPVVGAQHFVLKRPIAIATPLAQVPESTHQLVPAESVSCTRIAALPVPAPERTVVTVTVAGAA